RSADADRNGDRERVGLAPAGRTAQRRLPRGGGRGHRPADDRLRRARQRGGRARAHHPGLGRGGLVRRQAAAGRRADHWFYRPRSSRRVNYGGQRDRTDRDQGVRGRAGGGGRHGQGGQRDD